MRRGKFSGLDGQFHLEMSAFSRLTFNTDATVVLLDDFVADVQAQARAFTDVLGGKKRFEHILADGPGYAGAGVPA